MADVEFFEVGKACIHQADVDAVVTDDEFAKAAEGGGQDEVYLVMVCDKVLYRGTGN